MSEQPAAPVIPEFDLADRLRKALRHSNVGIQEMAEYLEVSRNTIGNWINGHTRPRPAELKMWALRCGVDYRWLVGDASARNPDIPSGITGDLDAAVTKEEILAYRKRVPIRRLADPLIVLLARSAS